MNEESRAADLTLLGTLNIVRNLSARIMRSSLAGTNDQFIGSEDVSGRLFVIRSFAQLGDAFLMVIVDGTSGSQPPSALADNVVHVWFACLQQTAEVVQRLGTVLSEDEKTRAERFRSADDRRSFIVGRGILRTLLAGYLNLEPGQLQFEYTQNGKPIMSRSYPTRDVCFNLSHSAGAAIFAFAKNRRIGIDIEHMHPMTDMEQIAASNFSEKENLQFKTVQLDEKPQAFFNCWTRKEAFIKAIGEGLSFPLHQFDVSLVPGEPARLVSIFGREQEARQWSMYELRPAAGYVAALVVEGDGCSISYQEWTSR